MASVQISSPCINGGVKVLSTQDTMPFTTTKGLLNGPGQNNCFLNSAVQVLWHLDIFRRSFRDLSGHACMAESCIFCALKELFSQLQFSNETALPPDALRRALAESFFDQQRFQLGFMDDAAECFENILLRIHTHIAQGVAEDMCNVRQCIPHQKFAMTLVEQSICGACQATSEPLSFTQMVHYVSASALTTQVRQNVLNGRKPSQDSFGELLRKAGSMGDIRDCPSTCGAKIQISRTLMNRPEIVSIGIVWDSERPTLEHIMDVFATVGTTLKLGDVFHKVVDNRWAEITTHNLVGVVTYYGKHYSTFFFHTKFRVWIYFDDATVREIGARWEQVVEKCRRGRHQPLLLLYAVPNGSPVTMECVQQAATIYEKNKVDNQAIFRRSVTPSPEKPNIGSTRRAITPNPDGTLGQKTQIPINNRLYNEYQNLSIIQDNIYGRAPVGTDVVDAPKNVSVHRTPSNGSSSGVESFNLPDHIPIIRRRDSGNWSGDRNSASSASSTTMENPYLYLLGKIPHHNTNGSNSIPSSPTRKTDYVGNGNLNGNGNVYDAGYDSYSLSSNDSSSMNTIQHLMKMGHLAKIPEDYSNLSEKPTLNCDALCNEADELLKKSRHFEDEHDLVLALALCNAAATKARAAMNAPYNNPQTLTLARMKYNTCIMRARSLHRRMTQTPINSQKEPLPEIRHTREGSSGSGKHSRQNSRDKTLSSSRQNSKELLVQPETIKSPQKSIEIYATLPKKKDTLKNKVNINFEEDSEYILYDKPARESRSIFSKSKNKDNKDKKRSRSEDRNKMSKDFSIAPEILINKDTLKREKKDEKEDKKEKDGKNKKQHKIRRKLLMGGLIKRKNRSMPDLTDTNENESKPISSVDDSNIGIKNENLNSMCGYLSEGHLEFTGNSTNPTLERSKLMRKSFHGSAGKVLTAAKVPPPPPLRTTSQLSAITKLPGSEVVENNSNNYYNYNQFSNFTYNHQRSGSHDVLIYQTRDAAMNQINTVVTQAEVHQVQSPVKSDDYYTQPHPMDNDEGVDEVDCCLPSLQNLELPPYPSPACSVIHSRQASEDFPPPPPPLDLSALEEHLPDLKPSTLLSELQNKRQEIFTDERKQEVEKNVENVKSGDVWLKELQAKQAALRQKKAIVNNLDAITVQKENNPNDSVVKSTVKDLASRFEIKMSNNEPVESPPIINNFLQRDSKGDNTIQTGVLSLKKREEIDIENYQHHQNLIHLQQEIIHHPLQRTNSDGDDKKCKAKKKSVSFCDQVILVATAEEQEDDSYIPNPILERVLRTAMNKPEAAAIRQEILLRQSEQIKDEGIQIKQDGNVQINHVQSNQQAVYVSRQNSIDNLLVSSHYQHRQSPYQMLPQNQNYTTIPQNNPRFYQQDQIPNYPQWNQDFLGRNLPTPNNSQENIQIQNQPPLRNQPNGNYHPIQRQNVMPYSCQTNYNPGFQHPPSPSPSNQSYSTQSSYNSQNGTGRSTSQQQNSYSYPSNNQYSPVQRVPPQIDYNQIQHFNQTISPYQRVPSREDQLLPNNPQNSLYQRVPSNDQINQYQNHFIPNNSPYQRVPDPNYPYQPIPQNYQQKYSPYQQVLPPKQPAAMKKTVSFEPGTKGGAETSSPKAIVTPIIVNNNNNNYTSAKTKCNLCRKKHVIAPNLYCADCEFYMSRFKPKS
ncbi:uncharacterized protein [Onthophagus taurus]|uniref:uncharacterized protein isoform X1 n=1 Tax=Onthophagus taurus TaxID=166361 RepID=UPI0039BE0B41